MFIEKTKKEAMSDKTEIQNQNPGKSDFPPSFNSACMVLMIMA